MDSGPFIASTGKKAYNDNRWQSEKRSRNAMLLAAGCIAVALMSAGSALRANGTVRPIPHLIVIDQNGRSTEVKPLADDLNLRDEVVKKEIRNFVAGAFSRTGSFVGDRATLARDVNPFAPPNDPSYTSINARLGDPDFNPRTAKTLAEVVVQIPSKRADDSWYVKWTVTTKSPDNTVVNIQTFDATMVVKYRTLETDDAQVIDPTGLEIVTFPFQEFKG